ncbi:MAG: host attachment protein [Hyphomonadaceae bacterium]
MKSEITWVATFDGAACRVFHYRIGAGELIELEDEARSGPHKPRFEAPADTVYSSASPHRGAAAPRTDAERNLETAFVADVAAHLEMRAAARAFDRLIVAAGPRALGAFRETAPAKLKSRVTREIVGDYVNADAKALLGALA